jgi:hypothetical protein
MPAYLLADDAYFPDKIFSQDRPDMHKFINDRYCKHLKVLKEPSIYQQKSAKNKTVIRFTLLRTFHNPICLRIVTNTDGSGTLYVKKSNGAGGYDPGELITNDKKVIEKQIVSTIISSIEDMDFWSLPSTMKTSGLDGSHWIIEYLSGGKYHLVDRWSPTSGSIRKLGLNLLELSGLEVKEIY